MRRFLTLLACLLTAGLAMADRVSEREALKKAQAFMPGERFEMKKYASPEGGQTEEPPFYIFNVENGGGYVLVSGNDQTTAILGYSTNGNIDLANMPDNLRYWLESYAAQLKAIDEGTPIAARAASGDKAMTRGTRNNIAPMLTTKWDQSEPFNLMCPDGNFVDYNADGYPTTYRCVTGCVATALAQVMYYHKWPQGQTTTIPQYSIEYSNAPTLSLNELPATTFEWNKMKPSYSETKTGEAADAVAKLMRYVGQACQMAYGTGASTTHIYTDMMISAFGYSKNIHKKYRDGFTTKQWEDMVYDELANERPVLYRGSTDTGNGHQFVCDGYKDGLFSLNWGWGGDLNGYFVLSIAEPDGVQGIGGSIGAFRFDQAAIFNFMPASANEEETPFIRSVITNNTTSTYTRTSASDNFTGISISGSYQPEYAYQPITTYEAEIGWGLYQDEQLVKCVGSSPITIDFRTIPAGYFYTDSKTLSNISFGKGLSDGTYQLRQIFRKAGSNDAWTLMDNYGSDYLVAEINGTNLTVRGRNTSTEVFSVNSINVPDNMIKGEPATVTVNITNEGETNQETVLLWLKAKGSSEWTLVASTIGYVGPDAPGNVDLTFTPSSGGSFTLKVTDKASDAALATKDISIFDIFQKKVDNINYSCVSGLNIATVIGGDFDKPMDLTIPAKISDDNGIDYSVKAIGVGAFYGCGNLSSVSLPVGLKTIGYKAFYNCYCLNTVTLPRGLETIGDEAFAACFWLKTIVLPSSLKSIGDGAFSGEDAMKEVTSRILDPSDISDETFTGIDFDTWELIPFTGRLYVPAGTKSKYENCAGWSTIFQGKIEEINFANGDANGDNNKNITDAVDTISFLLGGNPESFDAAAVDMNGDGIVTVTDIILLMIACSLLP